MSLDYDLSGIENHKELCHLPAGEKDGVPMFVMNPVTEALIFNAMRIGLREITPKNIQTWLKRTRDYEDIGLGFLYTDVAVRRPITIEDLRAHVGLKTNVSMFTTRQHNAQVKKVAAGMCVTFAKNKEKQLVRVRDAVRKIIASPGWKNDDWDTGVLAGLRIAMGIDNDECLIDRFKERENLCAKEA